MLQLFKRITLPLLILAILIALLNLKDRFGYEEIIIGEAQGIEERQLGTPVFSLRRAPELLTSPLAIQQLQEDLSQLVNLLPEASCFKVSADGEEIYSFQENIPLNPGAVQKIITAYAALNQLGDSFQYETVVAAKRETDEDGLLRTSDLYIFGSGDPLIRTDAYMELLPDSYSDIRTSADELADLTVGMNVLFIQGAVVVNESRYDEERTIAGWDQELKDADKIGSLSASLFDGGFDGLKQNYSQQRGENPLPLIPSANPAKRFAANFDDLLEARGVIILKVANEVNNVEQDSLVEILSIKSPTLDKIIEQMLTNDDNVTAEMILKEIGFSRTGQGSTGSGLVSLPEILAANDLPNTGLLLIDGSGLSRDNQATCGLFQEILEDSEYGTTIEKALPLVGVEGVVSDVFLGTPFESNLVAHTFFDTDRGALVGSYTTSEGIEVLITFIANYDDNESAENIHQSFINGLVPILSEFTGGKTLEEMGPRSTIE